MRLVLDTNIFVSAALKDKSLPALALRIASENATLLKSDATERQLFDVLARPYFASLIAPVTIAWFKTLFAAAESVPILEKVATCRDPSGDKFLELAVNGRSDFIVTGDADLLVLHPFRTVQILSPANFLQLVAR